MPKLTTTFPGKFVAMTPGAQVNKGEVIGSSDSGFVVLQPHPIPAGGYPVGFSNENVHFSLGYATSGLGSAIDGRILNPDGSAKPFTNDPSH